MISRFPPPAFHALAFWSQYVHSATSVGHSTLELAKALPLSVPLEVDKKCMNVISSAYTFLSLPVSYWLYQPLIFYIVKCNGKFSILWCIMQTTIHEIRLYFVVFENAWYILFGSSSSSNLNSRAALWNHKQIHWLISLASEELSGPLGKARFTCAFHPSSLFFPPSLHPSLTRLHLSVQPNGIHRI